MLRIIKYFDMPLPGVAVQRLAFTADPGAHSKREQLELRILEGQNVCCFQCVSILLLSHFPFVPQPGITMALARSFGVSVVRYPRLMATQHGN